MKRNLYTTGLVIVLLICLSTFVFADSTIKLFFNGTGNMQIDTQVVEVYFICNEEVSGGLYPVYRFDEIINNV